MTRSEPVSRNDNGAHSRVRNTSLARPANEDSAEAGQLYRLTNRRPGQTGFYIAALLTVILTAMGSLVFLDLYSHSAGPNWLERYGIPAPDPETLTVFLPLATLLLVTVIVIWLTAIAIWRVQDMRLMSDALRHTALKMTEPDDTASIRVQSLGQAVRHEIQEFQEGMANVAEQAATLNADIGEQLDKLDQNAQHMQQRGAWLEKTMTANRESLQEIAGTLGEEACTIRQMISGQIAEIRSVSGYARQEMEESAERLQQQTRAITETTEAAVAGTDLTTGMLERHASQIGATTASALEQAEILSNRYQSHQDILEKAVRLLEHERTLLDTTFTQHHNTLDKTIAGLATRTREVRENITALAGQLDAVMHQTEEKGRTVGDTFQTQVRGMRQTAQDTVTSVADAAQQASHRVTGATSQMKTAAGLFRTDMEGTEEILKEIIAVFCLQTEELTGYIRKNGEALRDDFTGTLQQLRGEMDQHTASIRATLHTTSSDVHEASEKLGTAMFRIGGAARDAGQSLNEATKGFEARVKKLPEEALEGTRGLQNVLEEQLETLAAIAEIVAKHARVFDRSTDPRSADPQRAEDSIPVPQSRIPDPMPLPTPGNRAEKWRLPDLLAATRTPVLPPADLPSVSGKTGEPASSSTPAISMPAESGDFSRSALHIIETLQSLSADLDQALEQSPPVDLWKRYQAGERNIFTRRLYSLQGRKLYDRIAGKYATQPEFRNHADRYIHLFEQLMAAAKKQDRDGILTQTYLTSDTGKVYLMLAQSSGRLR